MLRDFFRSLYALAVDMGFYMMIGLVLVAVLNIFIKKQWIAKHLGGNGIWSVVKASIMGVPLPLCSCGVVPTGLYLKDKGASDASVISFLISTPQTGADSIIATYGLMGSLFAWYRPLAAFFSGILGGAAHKLFSKKAKNTNSAETLDSAENKPIKVRAASSVKYAFGEFIDGISVHFLIGLVLASVIAVAIPDDFILSIGLGSGILSMLIMIAIGAPMYICSTSSIPIAVMLMAKGLSPGAAFVFLFMGPFTNAASLVLISKKLGRKTTLIYFLSAAVSALGFGMLLNYIAGKTGAVFNYIGISQSEIVHTPFKIAVSSVFLALVLFYSARSLVNFIRKIRAKAKAGDSSFSAYQVEGLDCKRCAAGLEAAFRGQEGVLNAEVDFESKQLKVWGDIGRDDVKQAVEAHGYILR